MGCRFDESFSGQHQVGQEITKSFERSRRNHAISVTFLIRAATGRLHREPGTIFPILSPASRQTAVEPRDVHHYAERNDSPNLPAQ